MSDEKPIKEPIKVSLSGFIEENHKLLSTIGIFTALTVFSFNLKLSLFGYGLSFLFLAMTVLLWLELISKVPPKGSGILGWFEAILGIAVLGLIAYWFVDYRPVWNIIMPLFIQLLLLGIISFLVKKFNVFNRLFQAEPGSKKVLRYILYFLILFSTLYFGLRLGYLISPSINYVLEQLRNAFQ